MIGNAHLGGDRNLGKHESDSYCAASGKIFAIPSAMQTWQMTTHASTDLHAPHYVYDLTGDSLLVTSIRDFQIIKALLMIIPAPTGKEEMRKDLGTI